MPKTFKTWKKFGGQQRRKKGYSLEECKRHIYKPIANKNDGMSNGRFSNIFYIIIKDKGSYSPKSAVCHHERLLIGAKDAAPKGTAYQLSNVFRLGFLQHLPAVIFHSMRRDEQLLGYFPAAEPPRQQIQDFQLARCEANFCVLIHLPFIFSLYRDIFFANLENSGKKCEFISCNQLNNGAKPLFCVGCNLWFSIGFQKNPVAEASEFAGFRN